MLDDRQKGEQKRRRLVKLSLKQFMKINTNCRRHVTAPFARYLVDSLTFFANQ